MVEVQRCPNCGQVVPSGQAECPLCQPGERTGAYRPEAILLLSLLVLAILFVFAGFAAGIYHAKEKSLGEEWYRRGDAELTAGRPEPAITDFRTALVYYRENDECELSLAKALLAANHMDEARAHLARLWDRQPENGEINLAIGRLAVQGADVDQALRYLHNAVYGDWRQENAQEERRQARLELYQFLIHRGASKQAQAELMALAAELPPDAQLHNQVGMMFFKANDFNQAEKQFLQSLQLERNNKDAAAGAGMAEFTIGDYRTAISHLERAARMDPQNTSIVNMLETTRLVLSIDPFQARLTSKEQNARITRAFRQALERLKECAQSKGEKLDDSAQPATPLRDAYARGSNMEPTVQEKILNSDPETSTTVLAWVTEAENLSASVCGTPTGLDEAIILALRKRGGSSK